MYLSIIIPLFNEQESVINLLKELETVDYPDFLDHYEIVIVDDCSKDHSFEAIAAFAVNNAKVKIFKHNNNQGKGAAVRTGVSKSEGDVIIIQDADMELSPHDIPVMLAAMNTLKIPFVNGSRYLPGVLRTQASFKRYFFNKLFTVLTSLLIDVHLTDMPCGYKLVSKKLFNDLKLKENRFGFEAELLIKCARLRKNWITEIPVHYYPRNRGEGKKLNHLDGFRIFKTIIKYGLFRMN
jgi:glycosyltransferase involved in cell wall biosynthesis